MKLPQVNLAQLKKRLSAPSGSQSSKLARLFFYTDGFQLNAAIITREGDKLKILATAQHSASSAQALSHILTDLSTQVAKLPHRAIMLHSRMALGILDLPNAELSDEKIANIMRWEMETLYSEQAPQWSIGSLLVQLGIIEDHERDAIIAEQVENRHRAASFGGKLPRFGDILISQGKCVPSGLEEYLSLQTDLQDKDTSVTCGWYKAQEQQQVFCAAMSTEEQAHWVALFADVALRVDRFYPAMGSLAALIESKGQQCLLELHSSSLVCSYLDEGHFKQMEILNCMDKSLDVEDVCAALLRCEPAFKQVYIWGNHPRTETLIEQLQPKIDAVIILLAWPDSRLIENESINQAHFLMPFLGVAQDYFFQDLHQGRLPYVQGALAPPPWYQKRDWQLAASGLAIISILMGTDVYFHGQVQNMKADIAQLETSYKQLKSANKKQKRENRRYLKLDNKLISLEAAYEELQQKKKAIEDNLIERQKFMSALLPLLISSIDKEVVLDSLNEDSWYQFRLSGWALNQAAINRFQQALSRSLSVFQMRISKSPSTLLKTGELAGGYRFDFEVIQIKPVNGSARQ